MLTTAQEGNELRSVPSTDLLQRIVGQGGPALLARLSQLPSDSAFFSSLLIATALADSTFYDYGLIINLKRGSGALPELGCQGPAEGTGCSSDYTRSLGLSPPSLAQSLGD